MDTEAFRAYTRINRVVATLNDEITRQPLDPDQIDTYLGMVKTLTAVQAWIYEEHHTPDPSVTQPAPPD